GVTHLIHQHPLRQRHAVSRQAEPPHEAFSACHFSTSTRLVAFWPASRTASARISARLDRIAAQHGAHTSSDSEKMTPANHHASVFPVASSGAMKSFPRGSTFTSSRPHRSHSLVSR